jgi:hypothetical protein
VCGLDHSIVAVRKVDTLCLHLSLAVSAYSLQFIPFTTHLVCGGRSGR